MTLADTKLLVFLFFISVQEEFGLSLIQREIFVGSINFWAIFGAFSAQYFSDGYGRRSTFLVAAVGFLLGIFVMVVSNSYELLLFGRTFVGLGVGIGLAVDPMYISEMSPALHRGKLVTYSEIALNIGIVLGFTTGLVLAPFDQNREWRAMFLFGTIMPVAMIILIFTVMPESPRWLVSKRRIEEAKQILKKIYPANYDVGCIVQEIQETLEIERMAQHDVGWHVIFQPTPAFRRMLMVGVGIAVAQQAVGIDAIQYYLLDVIEKTSVTSKAGESAILILLGLIKLVFIFVGGRLFDRRGRRPLLFASLLGMSVALFLISLGFFIDSTLSGWAIIVGLAIYLACFSIGMGPGGWLIPSEVFTTSIRGKAMSIATLLNRVTATLMSSTFLTTANGLGWGGFFLLLSFVCLIVLVFLCFYLPETNGRTLEDISMIFTETTGDTSILEAEARLHEHATISTKAPQTESKMSSFAALESEII